MEAARIIDREFTVNRHRLIAVAEFLDLVDAADGDGSSLDDARMTVFRRAVAELLTPDTGRSERIRGMFAGPAGYPDPAGVSGGALDGPPERE